MAKSAVTEVSCAVEGLLDEAIVSVLVRKAGGAVGTVYGKNGKSYIRTHIGGYNSAARFSPWVVLVDLDSDADCPPPLRQLWLPAPSSQMCFRIAVRESEAWLLADPETLAVFLGIPCSRVPAAPEGVGNPKRTIVQLARSSRRGVIRAGMVPREGSGRSVGPEYTSLMIEYVSERWRPDVAAISSQSLSRSLSRIRELVNRM